ncbi:MAG TPA: metallophosphoesterase [Cyclobacteriaceae bacterium]|nr:metallophosphoesterase [Cyclobacteriaceae bacterium]HRJ81593.1 metallophosphoesterase [Cyclobacteriaceae bacterium]
MQNKVAIGLNRLVTLWLIGCSSIVAAQKLLVPPYLQPGNSPNLSKEQKVLIWQTDSIPGNFTVLCTSLSTASSKPLKVKVTSDKLQLLNKTTYLYRAELAGLKFDETYSYEVILNSKSLYKGQFDSRTKKAQTRFAVFGDCGAGTSQQAQIAYQVYQQKPQFVLVTGDQVYSNGRELEYRHRFFPFYTSPDAAPDKGAPLMNTVPFYMLLGNHDIYSANFNKYPDGLAFFYYNDLPRNGPLPAYVIQPEGNPELIKAFKKNTSPRYPGISNYSYDYGNVHITCLDANTYVNPLDPTLIEWFRNDIKNSKADWKIVSYHHPAFNGSPTHYDYQIMRLIAPICEELGVDLVLTGHVHNYQRTVPLKFSPKVDETTNRYVVSDAGSVDGRFTLDTIFDGVNNTRPNGIIYIVSGAGGAVLYDKEISDNPALWKKGTPENWVPYTVKVISDKHSFTMIETDGKKLNLKQLDVSGNILDEITITK